MDIPANLNSTRKRMLFLILAIIFLFCALTIRLAYVQLVMGQEYQAKATDQWYRDLPLAAPRGIIYDANGVILADNKDAFTVYVRPKAVKDFAIVAKELADKIGLDEKAIFEKISSTKVSEITIARKISKEKAEPLRALNLDGVYLTADSQRNYPQSTALSQILGFTNIDNVGQNGLEGYYDQYLKGVDGFAYTNTDMAGREIETTVTKYVPAIAGLNLTLSVDANIQLFAEYAVKSALEQYGAKSTSMLIMDCTDGGIVACATAPNFDLNDPPRDNIDLLNQLSKNKMIVDVCEPGSTFKIFTTAAAIENGLTKDSDRYACSGSRTIDGQRIKCWRSIGHGSQTLAQGVMNSCNCVFMDLALRLGTDRLYDSLYKFGFNAKTNIDFYGESRGIVMPKESVKTVDLARIGFGQAVAVTPLQLVTAVSAVVNGGTLYEPYFVKSITDNTGKVVASHSAKKVRQVISKQTSEQMKELLENVVALGSGKKAQVAGYRIGGKTGTAQKYENGHIAQGKYLSSFVGFAPVENPKYVILMLVDEPKPGGAYYGSIVAAPFAGDVFSRIFNYTALKPSLTPETVEMVNMPMLVGAPLSESIQTLKSLGLQYELAGESGKIISTLPVAGTQIPKGDIVLIRLSDDG